MSYPINLSFKDAEFEQVNKAATKMKTKIREYIKDAATQKAEADLKTGSVS